jgi:hypothetical protein
MEELKSGIEKNIYTIIEVDGEKECYIRASYMVERLNNMEDGVDKIHDESPKEDEKLRLVKSCIQAIRNLIYNTETVALAGKNVEELIEKEKNRKIITSLNKTRVIN